MSNDLLFYLTGYMVAKEEIKEAKNPYYAVKFAVRKKEILKKIVPLIDNEVLSFKELYKLLKMYEERKNKGICFQTCRIEWNEEEYEDTVLIDYISIERKQIYGRKETKYILVEPLYSEFVTPDPTRSQAICSDLVKSADVGYILSELKCLKDEYYSFLNYVVAYLIKKYM